MKSFKDRIVLSSRSFRFLVGSLNRDIWPEQQPSSLGLAGGGANDHNCGVKVDRRSRKIGDGSRFWTAFSDFGAFISTEKYLFIGHIDF